MRERERERKRNFTLVKQREPMILVSKAAVREIVREGIHNS